MEPYQQLEAALAAWAGYPAENMVVTSSGSAALHVALEAFRIPLGAEVIVPEFAMIAVPRAVSLAGHVPLLVDCRDDLLLDLVLAERPVERDRALAIMAVHTYGRTVHMESVHRLASQHGLYIVEDLAEAHGVRPHPDTDAACWSFYRNKVIAGEEGGAVAFKDPDHACLARQLRNVGFTDDHDFIHIPRSHNYRLANALAVPILRSLAEYDYNLNARRAVERWYDHYCPAEWRMPPRDCPWVYDLRIPGLQPEQQTRIVRTLQGAGIAARHAFKPVSTQAEYRNCLSWLNGTAARASREVLYLPLTPGAVTEALAQRAFEVIATELRAAGISLPF